MTKTGEIIRRACQQVVKNGREKYITVQVGAWVQRIEVTGSCFAIGPCGKKPHVIY